MPRFILFFSYHAEPPLLPDVLVGRSQTLDFFFEHQALAPLLLSDFARVQSGSVQRFIVSRLLSLELVELAVGCGRSKLFQRLRLTGPRGLLQFPFSRLRVWLAVNQSARGLGLFYFRLVLFLISTWLLRTLFDI
jgi:hypothetical protein